LILFHASYKIFEVGQTYVADKETPYFLEKRSQGMDWVDLLLNEYKPDKAPIRQQTFFACDKVENCYAYISSRRQVVGMPIYYKVEMENPAKGVMCLTDIFPKFEKQNPSLRTYAEEYWSPTLEWKYYEYLSNQMKIIEILNEPDIIMKSVGNNNYMMDQELRKEVFGI